MRSILCIDDEPSRYVKLSRIAALQGIHLLVACRLEDVKFYLDRRALYGIEGICLDHDMGGNPHGVYYAAHVLVEHPDLPVAIVSLNPAGAKNIAHELSTNKAKYATMPVSAEDWGIRVLDFLQEYKP